MSESLEGGVVGTTGTVVSEETTMTSDPVEEVKANTEEVSTDGDEQKETEDKSEKAEKPKKKEPELTEAEKIRQSMQKRIDRKTAIQKQKEETLAQREQEIAQLKEQLSKYSPEPEAGPREEDFETYDEFIEAQIEHRTKQALSQKEQEYKQQMLQERQQAEQAEMKKAFDEKVHQFRVDKPDYPEKEAVFQEVVNDLVNRKGEADPTLGALGDFIIDSDVAPALMYELGNTPELVEDLASMKPMAALREMFKLEQSLSKRKVTRKESKPEPIKPVGGSKGNLNKAPDEMSASELMAWVNS